MQVWFLWTPVWQSVSGRFRLDNLSELFWCSRKSPNWQVNKCELSNGDSGCEDRQPKWWLVRNRIERVSGFKLLGIHIRNNLSWNLHVDYICARANTRLHYLKRLKRAGLPVDRLTHWYITVIRPVLEYCVVVWHHGLSKYQTTWLTATILKIAMKL